VKEFRILQTESFDKSIVLLYERCPIVVYPSPILDLWTQKDLKQRPSLKKEIQPYFKKPIEYKKSQELAKQIGIPVWVNQTILPSFKSLWWSPLLWTQSSISIGSQGLKPTHAFYTIIMVTEGEIHVSLLNESADAYLPKQWLGKRLSKLSRDDAPLLGQIQFIDVVVRPGSALLVPPHWKVCWESIKEPAFCIWIDVHHPISFIVQNTFYRKNTRKE
jgi:hypothetical protein